MNKNYIPLGFLLILLLAGALLLNHYLSDAPVEDISFNQEKWMEKEGTTYPYRHQMVREVLYNDTIRNLNRDELLQLLGEPSREAQEHLYFEVSRKRLGPWTVRGSFLVVKVNAKDSIDWIKLHN
jgi:hypothetical protein